MNSDFVARVNDDPQFKELVLPSGAKRSGIGVNGEFSAGLIRNRFGARMPLAAPV
jgi:hypothetical protein